jgi:hypothetical protein
MTGGYYASRERHGYNAPMSDERERVAQELRRIRDSVRERALLGEPEAAPAARPVKAPEAPPREAPAAAEPPPPRPDLVPVNTSWDTSKASTGLGALGHFMRRALAPLFESQAAFNSRQVQLDNALFEYLDARVDATHRHYDNVLGIHGRHMADIDERHLILQEELVAHVHDLVRRIDLVLAESEKGRLSLEFALRDVRNRLALLEERLPRG